MRQGRAQIALLLPQKAVRDGERDRGRAVVAEDHRAEIVPADGGRDVDLAQPVDPLAQEHGRPRRGARARPIELVLDPHVPARPLPQGGRRQGVALRGVEDAAEIGALRLGGPVEPGDGVEHAHRLQRAVEAGTRAGVRAVADLEPGVGVGVGADGPDQPGRGDAREVEAQALPRFLLLRVAVLVLGPARRVVGGEDELLAGIAGTRIAAADDGTRRAVVDLREPQGLREEGVAVAAADRRIAAADAGRDERLHALAADEAVAHHRTLAGGVVGLDDAGRVEGGAGRPAIERVAVDEGVCGGPSRRRRASC